MSSVQANAYFGIGATVTNDITKGELPAVLIVDDVDANLIVLEGLLEDLPCEVVRADSGNKALRELLRQEFAVVLLDVHMPHMDGFEVAEHIRLNPSTRHVPIVFLTAHHAEDKALRGYDAGAVDFLFKPVNADILRGKVLVFLELASARRLLGDRNRELAAKNAELNELAETQTALVKRLSDANQALAAAYRELQTTQGQLIQSAKMAALGELVAGVAHEINNPLAFVMSHLETVTRSLNGCEPQATASPASATDSWNRAQTRLTEMRHGLARIRDLVVKLRTFSRLDEGERKQINVRESIESVLTIVQHRMTDRIELELHVEAPEVIDCSAGLLNQALMNLLTNAIDAIPERGQIVVRAGAEGDTYVLSVSDTGEGIPPEIKERVVEPFFTTKPVGKGTGLGLSIAHSVVKQHGGRLELNDRLGGGTEAVLKIPL